MYGFHTGNMLSLDVSRAFVQTCVRRTPSVFYDQRIPIVVLMYLAIPLQIPKDVFAFYSYFYSGELKMAFEESSFCGLLV